MKKIIFTTTILLMILIMHNAKPFSDNITGYNGAVHDLKIPFTSKTYIVFEEN